MYKKYISFIGYFLVFVSIYFLGKVFVDNFGVFKVIPFTFKNIFILISVVVVYILVYFVFSYAWCIQLKEKYTLFKFKDSVSIIGRSQIGKYLPGNVGHFLGRLVLLPSYINKADVSYIMFIENIVMLVSSSVLGCLYMFYFDFFDELELYGVSLSVFGVIAFSLLVYILFKMLRRKFKFLKISNIILLKILFLSFVSSFIGGVAIYLLVYLYVGDFSITYLQCVFGFALSFLVGFITPGAPGGVGVRELTFVMLFKGFITEPIALEVIFTFRVLTVVGDILLFIMASLLKNEKDVLL